MALKGVQRKRETVVAPRVAWLVSDRLFQLGDSLVVTIEVLQGGRKPAAAGDVLWFVPAGSGKEA